MGGLPTSTVNGFAVQPSNPKVMYVGTRAGLFRTENAGQGWVRVEGPGNVAAVAVNPRRPTDVYAATVEGEMWISSDGGRRWEPRR